MHFDTELNGRSLENEFIRMFREAPPSEIGHLLK